MIISHKHKFSFVKTVKTAGTSIEGFLSQHCCPYDVRSPIVPPLERHERRNYWGPVHPLSEILRLPFGPISAWRHISSQRQRFYSHMPAWLVRLRVPAMIWTRYFKFCVDRNPWDKVLSHYHMTAHRQGGE